LRPETLTRRNKQAGGPDRRSCAYSSSDPEVAAERLKPFRPGVSRVCTNVPELRIRDSRSAASARVGRCLLAASGEPRRGATGYLPRASG
jgi:hypothetical protein